MKHDTLMTLKHKYFHLSPVVLLPTFFRDVGNYTLLITAIWGICVYDFVFSVSFSFYLSWCSRWFIKHPVIIKHSLIVCESVCLYAGVSPGNYLMLRSLMTTQTNICPEVIYKMRGKPSVEAGSVCVSVYMCMCVPHNMHLISELLRHLDVLW